MIKWNKGESKQLSRRFVTDEFTCKCSNKDCVEQQISPELVEKLQTLRDLVGSLKITSGFRCEKHNKAVGGRKNSTHTQGLAVDIQPVGDFLDPREDRRLPKLKKVAEDLGAFTGLGLKYKTFVHLDIKPGKVRKF